MYDDSNENNIPVTTFRYGFIELIFNSKMFGFNHYLLVSRYLSLNNEVQLKENYKTYNVKTKL